MARLPLRLVRFLEKIRALSLTLAICLTKPIS